MLSKLFKEETTALDILIDEIIFDMQKNETSPEEYNNLLAKLERLYELRANNRRKRVSPDALVAVAGNLMGIFVIVSYEHAHVITSKALGNLFRTK